MFFQRDKRNNQTQNNYIYKKSFKSISYPCYDETQLCIFKPTKHAMIVCVTFYILHGLICFCFAVYIKPGRHCTIFLFLLLRRFFVCVLRFQMNMLLRLQEAANYSSTQSCDSDSTSHHDDQLDSSLESALWDQKLRRETPNPRSAWTLWTSVATRHPKNAHVWYIWKVLLSKMVYRPFERKHNYFYITVVQY